jgi:hypothetical protein
MIVDLPDPLIARVAAADPVAGRNVGEDLDRERAERARRRRAARRRRRIGGAVAMLALGATLAAALLPSGGLDSSAILGRAVKAAELPPSSILVVVEDVHYGGLSGRVLGSAHTYRVLHERPYSVRTYAWVRTSAIGRVLAWRELDVSKDLRRSRDVVVHRTAARRWISSTYDTRSKRVLTARGATPPRSLVGLPAWRDARVVIEGVRARGGHVQMTGSTTVAGRNALHFTIAYPHRTPGFRPDELDIDATTYTPLRVKSPGYDARPRGLKAGDSLTQVVSWRVLPDIPGDRRFLRLRGPTR